MRTGTGGNSVKGAEMVVGRRSTKPNLAMEVLVSLFVVAVLVALGLLLFR
jgi:hypothetical protein